PPDPRQMLVATLGGFARRVQRIAEEDQAGNRQMRIRGGDLRCDASTHRLPADEEKAARAAHLRGNGIDDAAIAGFERRTAVGNPAALLGVEKIEGDEIE